MWCIGGVSVPPHRGCIHSTVSATRPSPPRTSLETMFDLVRDDADGVDSVDGVRERMWYNS